VIILLPDYDKTEQTNFPIINYIDINYTLIDRVYMEFIFLQLIRQTFKSLQHVFANILRHRHLSTKLLNYIYRVDSH
jgi:hypothetical protein